jgi:WD40 repeat protein
VSLWNLTSLTAIKLSSQMATTLGTGGDRMAAGFADGTVRAWGSHTGMPVASWQGVPGVIGAIAVSDDGRSVAAGTGHLVVAWDVVSGREKGRSIALQARPTGALTFDQTGTVLAMSGAAKSVSVWNIQNRTEQSLTGEHLSGVQAVRFVTPNVLISAATSGDVVRWILPSGQGEQIPDPTSQVTGVTIGPGAALIASRGFDGTTAVWRPDATLAEPGGAPDATILATDASGNRRAIVTAAGALTLSTNGAPPSKTTAACAASEGAFSPDGRQLALACPGGSVELWNAVTGEEERGLQAASALPALSVAYSPNGKRLAAELADGPAVVWELASSNQPVVLVTDLPPNYRMDQLGFDRQIVHCAFVDDNTLAYAGLRGVVLRDIGNGQQRALLTTPSRFPTTSMALSFDHQVLAQGSQDGSVTLWDTHNTAEPVASFAGGPLAGSGSTGSAIHFLRLASQWPVPALHRAPERKDPHPTYRPRRWLTMACVAVDRCERAEA